MDYILIIGANSDIAKEVARCYARNGYNLYLVARQTEILENFSNDLNIRYDCEVEVVELDVLNYKVHAKFYNQLVIKPIGVIVAVGYLGDQYDAEHNFKETQTSIDTNYTGIVSILNIIANDFEERQKGFIVCISSVAGDRGRKSNYIYGSAKAALSTYLSGLRNRLHTSHVHVLTVKPGFVKTKMTVGMALPKNLTIEPQKIAQDIYNAQQNKKDILYSKWIWKWIMFVIKIIPETLFKKTNF